MKPTLRFTCSSASVTLLQFIYDHQRQIKHSSFCKMVDAKSRQALEKNLGYAIGDEPGLHLKDDRYPSYFKSKLPNGKVCFNMEHSCIDHIFY